MARTPGVLTAILIVTALFSTSELWGADLANGRKIFESYCAGCHRNGGNTVAADKTLQSDALKKNGVDSLKTLESKVRAGGGKMPAFGGFLSAGDVTDVAAWVLEQAGQGWQ